MIRKFNYTERKRIKRSDVEIFLRKEDGKLFFDANLSKLQNYDLHKKCSVYLEAYRITNWMRFSLGSLGSLSQLQSDCLDKFESSEGIHFRIKIIAPGESHKIVAKADSIPLLNPNEEESEVIPLLPVIPSDELDNEIYRVSFSGDYPVLLINNAVGNYKEIGRSTAFISLVYPSVLREILIQIFLIDKQIDHSDFEDWHTRWILFIKQLHGLGELPSPENVDECNDYIQRAVESFAKKMNSRGKFLEFWKEEQCI